jgi:hypothetical protein
MNKSGGAHEISLAPSGGIEPGKVYAYKIVADGKWTIDPDARYRKIVGGQLNGGLVLPACGAGPEALASRVIVDRDTMKVRLTLRSAEGGEPVRRVKASLDRHLLPAGAFTVDAQAGAIDVSLQGLAKGKHTLSVRAFDAKDRESEPIDLPFGSRTSRSTTATASSTCCSSIGSRTATRRTTRRSARRFTTTPTGTAETSRGRSRCSGAATSRSSASARSGSRP